LQNYTTILKFIRFEHQTPWAMAVGVWPPWPMPVWTTDVAHERRHAAARQPPWATTIRFFPFFFSNFVNDLKWRNCKYESCVSRKVTKLCSLQPFHLMLFRALKNNLYSARIIWGEKKLSMNTCDCVV
jgi:hypothetical protein